MAAANEHVVRLRRPIAIVDLETTGLWPEQDRIVQIGILTIAPGGRTDKFGSLIDPEMRIPREATGVHGITNRHIRGKPTFRRIAPTLRKRLSGCDLAGFNIRSFDLPFLVAEFERAGVRFDSNQCHIIDAKEIFHAKEPRDLAAALEFYCGEEHTAAHSALADALACWKVLLAQLRRYKDLPRTVAGLAKFLGRGHDRFLDSGSWFEPRDGHPVFARGKHGGSRLSVVAREAPDYLDWMLTLRDLPADTRRLIKKALR